MDKGLVGQLVLSPHFWGRHINFYHIDEGKRTAEPLEGAGYGNRSGKGNLPIEYFPEMEGFMYLGGQGHNVMVYDMKTKKARTLGTVPFGAHGVMEYNPVFKVMLVGGGDGNLNTVSLVDAKGKITRAAPSPVAIRCTSESKLTVCPATGEFLAHGRDAKHMFAFHPVHNEWKPLKRGAPGGMAAPIPEYGVVLFCTAGKNPQVYVYKHQSPWPAEGDEGVGETPAKAGQTPNG